MPEKLLDRIGACASAVCAVHCLLTGVAMSLLAFIGLGRLANPVFDAIFVGIAALVGVLAVFHGIKRHHSLVPALVFCFGLLFIGVSFVLGHGHDSHATHEGSSNLISTTFSVFGGLLIIAFHFINSRMQHRGCGCKLDKSRQALNS